MLRLQERQLIAMVLVILTILSGLDLVEDSGEGASPVMLLEDVINFAITAALLAYIWLFQPLTSWRQKQRLSAETARQRADLDQLFQVARKQLEGLAVFINAQFDNWELTPAEKEVALLLLKGFSMREIAELRGISERTARQQATTVYGKSGQSGRAALSAYFLEDLLLPQAK